MPRKPSRPKTYVFDQPCTMSVTVQATNTHEARKKLDAAITHKSVNIEQDIDGAWITIGPDTGADADLVDSYSDWN